ncbi:MAG: outer membrane beta-barrel protein [Rikenellaceae bacterium]|nr:outer membrane beta-barrel protein [Rikenellaceae bacterium]
MNEQYDKFEKRLADQLANHSVDAPADMWDRIAASMAEIDAAAKPATPPITIAPHRRQRLGVRRTWQYGIAAMLLLGIGLLANRLVRLAPQPDQSELLADATVLYDPASIANEEPAEEPINAEPTNEFARVQTTNARKSESVLISEHSATEPSTEQETLLDTVESTNNHVPVESAASNDNHKQSPKSDNGTPTPREQYEKRLQEVLSEQNNRRGGRITASLYASNANRMSNQTPSTARLAEAGMVKTEVLNSSHGEVIDKLSSSSPLSVRKQTETKLNHRVPVTVGVGVQYELTDRWALETGATYTYLHSTGRSEGVFSYQTSQELHYVGVPLTASYKFIDGNRFELYARAGGAIERAVAAKRVQTVGTTDENLSNSTSQKIDCKGVQLSATVAVGAELKLSQRVGIYAEAGAGYFFDNNQPLSYRTEHPLSLTLQAGARLHFGTK